MLGNRNEYMKKIVYGLSFLIMLFCFVLISTSSVFAAIDSNSEIVDTNEVKGQIQSLLSKRASVMVSDQNIMEKDVALTSKQYEIENQTRYKISKYREELKKMNESYSDIKIDVDIIKYNTLPDGKLSLRVKETTYLTILQSGVETGYTAEHEFILEKNIDNQWIIVEDRHLEPIGILPLQEANNFLYGNKNSIEINYDNDLHYIEKPDTSLIREKNLEIKTVYNYSAMAAYLERYWSNYNPAYRNFNNQGGDCTNFVSQALKAGGWADKPGWYQNANYWWYNNYNQTYSWTSVNHWATFAINSGRTSMLYNVWSCRVGDVVQVKPSGSSTKVHTMMVSYYSNGVPYFTYHSSNRYRRSLNQVLLDWLGGTFYSYRT